MSYEALRQAVLSGDESRVVELSKSLLSEGKEPLEIVNEGLIGGMNIVGPKFKRGEMYVPEVLMSAKAMSSGLDIAKTVLTDVEIPSAGTVVIGTVEGDLHDIGKNLVAIMVESSGFKIVNLGVDQSVDDFIDAVKEHKPDVLGMSALLTTTMIKMQDTINALKEEGLRNRVKVIIGGAPITQTFADEIEADGYAPDGASAAELCKNLVSLL
jgi:5-methyltetrahydrofolate--homocysteine methyltransferase